MCRSAAEEYFNFAVRVVPAYEALDAENERRISVLDSVRTIDVATNDSLRAQIADLNQIIRNTSDEASIERRMKMRYERAYERERFLRKVTGGALIAAVAAVVLISL